MSVSKLYRLINIFIMAGLYIISPQLIAEQAKPLDSQQIKKLISGNSISGKYEGKNFKQNNHADGVAVVYIAGDKVNNVHWIANDRDEYCENWEGWGWSCFKLSLLNNNKLIAVKQGVETKTKYVWVLDEGFIDINP